MTNNKIKTNNANLERSLNLMQMNSIYGVTCKDLNNPKVNNMRYILKIL